MLDPENREIGPWIRVCALQALTAAQIPEKDAIEITEAALASPDGFVRETALWALHRLQPVAAGRYGEDLKADPSPAVARLAARLRGAMEGDGAMLSTIEKILFLKSVDLFEQVPDEDVVWIAEVCEQQHFAAGERFIRQGDSGDCLYVTLAGEIDIIIDGVGKVATRGERSVNGEMAILSRSLRTASCVAATEVDALKIDRREFLELLREKPELGLGIIQVLVRRLDEVSRQAGR